MQQEIHKAKTNRPPKEKIPYKKHIHPAETDLRLPRYDMQHNIIILLL